CLVSQVFSKLTAGVGVDNALASLCQEEGAPLRQLGIIELQEVDEGVAVIEDIDFDRVVAFGRVKIEMLSRMALQCLGGRNGRGGVLRREIGEEDESAGADLVASGHERLGALAQRSATRECEEND